MPSTSPTATAAATPRLYTRNFLLALVSQMCFVIAHTLMAHYARWIEFLEGDLGQVGRIMGFGAIFGLLVRPWMAQWIDRFGAKRMWAAGFAIFSLGTLANLILFDLGIGIYILRSTILFGTALVFASSLTYIAQTAPEARRTEAIGILGVGGFAGMLVGPFLGDLFLGSGERSRADFANLFIVAACVNSLPLILLTQLKSAPHNHRRVAINLGEFWGTIRRYWPGTILLVDFVFGVCMTTPFIFVASFIDAENLQIGKLSVLGVFFWCYAGPAIVLRIGLRQLPDRIGVERVLIIGLLAMACGMASFALVNTENTWRIVLPAFLCGVGHSFMFHTMTSLTIQPFPTDVRGTASALALMMLDLGTLVGAPLLGLIGEYLGYSAMFLSLSGICILTIVIFARTHAALETAT